MIYRKYRPKTFTEICGQDLIIKVLKSFLKHLNSLPHGYLFAGQRGTGKTSTARIFAKALNCLNLEKNSYEPCNNCFNCEAINQNKFLDIIELDAASNRGIDEIRNLKENIGFKPIQGKYKVFIIDEAHMLTKEAFNALLKVLEEPPKHVIFILATTEPEKIPPTILSRLQRFDFRRISINEIIKKLKKIAQEENCEITDGALYLIAEESEGALRDAETLLERIMLSLNPHKNINEEYVEQFLGKISAIRILEFINFILNKDFEYSLKMIHNIYNEGYDFIIFTRSLIKILREILMIKIYPLWKNQLNKEYNEELIKKILEIANKIDLETNKKLIRVFSEAELGLKKDPPLITLPLELAIAELILN
ncbi:MAG: DNA polymerase III subunit gamma/tau [Patescibacteria group bacterium]|nr:DNA polymerase III subunit gamma/tau [Patescibacteria group bacterium]